MKKNDIEYFEKDPIMGSDTKIPVRVIFRLVPDEVKEHRLREAKHNAHSRKWNVTDEF
jgi:hypothetical protein